MLATQSSVKLKNYLLLVLFSDFETSWPRVVQSNGACTAKSTMTSFSHPVSSLDTFKTYTVTGVIPRWWYIVIANCNSNSSLDVRYSILFTNRGGPEERHFSKDEQGIYLMSIVYLSIFSLLLIWLTGTILYAMRKKVHWKVRNLGILHFSSLVWLIFPCLLNGFHCSWCFCTIETWLIMVFLLLR